jgi:hypothetical protein
MAEDNVVGSGEPEEEVIDLFAGDEFNEKELLPEEPASEDEGGDGGDTGSEAPADDDLPEKFRGKSVKEIVDSYENLEKEYGRRNNEIGELRQQVNSIIERQLTNATSTDSDEDDYDLEENPKAAVAKAVAESPEVKEIREALVQRERAEGLAKFKGVHPDSDKVIADPRFREWVSSSATRVRLFNEADANYDYDIATDLLNDYKAMVGQEAEQASEQREGKVKALKNAAPASGGAGKGKTKKYKASDLMRLKNTDPDRYDKLQGEITRAYSEGRVIRDI